MRALDTAYLRDHGTSDAFRVANLTLKNIRLTCKKFNRLAADVVFEIFRAGPCSISVTPVEGGFGAALQVVDALTENAPPIEWLHIDAYPPAKGTESYRYVSKRQFFNNLANLLYICRDIKGVSLHPWPRNAAPDTLCSSSDYDPTFYLWMDILHHTFEAASASGRTIIHFRLPAPLTASTGFPSSLLNEDVPSFQSLHTSQSHLGITTLELHNVTDYSSDRRTEESASLFINLIDAAPNLRRLTFTGSQGSTLSFGYGVWQLQFLPLEYFELGECISDVRTLDLFVNYLLPRGLKTLYLRRVVLEEGRTWAWVLSSAPAFRAVKLFVRELGVLDVFGEPVDVTEEAVMRCRGLGWDFEVDKSQGHLSLEG